MFSFTSKVRFSETDSTQHLSLANIINYFQDCSEFHSQSLGSGASEHTEYAWIMTSWQIQVKRYPERNEEIEICTAPHELKGIMAQRNFLIKDAAGKVIVNANSIWSYLDLGRGRPIPIPDHQKEIYALDQPYPMDYAPRKISLKQLDENDFSLCETITVRHYELDMFGHMNNAWYIGIANEYIPKEFSFNQVRVEYKKSALLGDTVNIYRYQTEDKLFFHLKSDDNETYCILEYSLI